MIITEHSYVALQGIARKKQLSIADDACIPGLKNLVAAIHEGGALAVAQLNHAGAAADTQASGMAAVAPSSVVLPTNSPIGENRLPEALGKDQLDVIAEEFVAAAARAKEAGYDGVEIHSAHAYLLNQFYSPLTNKREDEYGGSLENRVRFHRQVIRAVRAAVGEDYPVFIRLGACDYMEGGSTIDDAVAAAKIFEAEGVDLIDVSGGMCRYTRKGNTRADYFRDVSKAIKDAVSVKVNLTGGVKTKAEAEALLEAGVSDLIGVGRELLKDAEWDK